MAQEHVFQRVIRNQLTCWERLKVGGKGDDRGWDGWMASLTPWTWAGVNSGSWWWTGKPGVLWFMGLQRARYDWAIELNWTGQRPMSWVTYNIFQLKEWKLLKTSQTWYVLRVTTVLKTLVSFIVMFVCTRGCDVNILLWGRGSVIWKIAWNCFQI